jgi:pSer/pThr/pTyr-binding forkhead associated (FHA) protein
MRLEIHHETGRKEIVTFSKDKAVVGNGDTADIQIEGEHISRNQLILEQFDGKIYITDLDNPNGTYINDSLIEPHKRIEFLSFFPIQIGPKILIYLMPEEEEEVKSEPYVFKDRPTEKISSSNLSEDDFPSQTAEKRKGKNISPPTPSVKKVQENKKQTKNIYITLLFLGLAGSGYLYHLKKEETNLQEKNLNINDPYVTLENEKKEADKKLYRKLMARPKCTEPIEQKLCHLTKIQFHDEEGIKILDNMAYLILNFDRAQVTNMAEEVAEVPPPYRAHYLTLKVISSPELWMEFERAGISKLKLINLLTVQNETTIVSTYEINQHLLFSKMSLDDIHFLLYSLKNKKNHEIYNKINWEFVDYKSF